MSCVSSLNLTSPSEAGVLQIQSSALGKELSGTTGCKGIQTCKHQRGSLCGKNVNHDNRVKKLPLIKHLHTLGAWFTFVVQIEFDLFYNFPLFTHTPPLNASFKLLSLLL